MAVGLEGGDAMKGMLFSVAGFGLGGAAFFGMADGPDFDRVVNRSPMQVYAAFSALAQEGTVTEPQSELVKRRVTLRTAKTSGEAIRYEILFDDRPVITADLTFAAADESGRTTRMTAELDLDAYQLGSAFETEGGMALSLIPEGLIDRQFAAFMDDLVDDVEAGRPLPPLDAGRAGLRAHNVEADPDYRRAVAETARHDAARPMVRPVPMVDPNREAARNRAGNPGDRNYAD